MEGIKLLLVFGLLILRIETLFCSCVFPNEEANLNEFFLYDKIVKAKVISVLDSATLSPYSTFLNLQIDENFKGEENKEISIFSFNYSIKPAQDETYLFYVEVDEEGNNFIGMCTRTKEWEKVVDKSTLENRRFENEVNNLRKFKKIRKDKLDGEFVFKYLSGNLMAKFSQSNGELNGEFELRNEKSETISKGKYINGLKEGCWEEIYSKIGDSKIIERGNYSKGIKTGRWPRYIQRKGEEERYVGVSNYE